MYEGRRVGFEMVLMLYLVLGKEKFKLICNVFVVGVSWYVIGVVFFGIDQCGIGLVLMVVVLVLFCVGIMMMFGWIGMFKANL